jgi:hypothetical protein
VVVATPAGFEPATPGLEGRPVSLFELLNFANCGVFVISENNTLPLNRKLKIKNVFYANAGIVSPSVQSKFVGLCNKRPEKAADSFLVYWACGDTL